MGGFCKGRLSSDGDIKNHRGDKSVASKKKNYLFMVAFYFPAYKEDVSPLFAK